MRTLLSQERRRTGFTLVELMVSVTLIIFIMVILTEAFKAGIDAFRNLKAAGDASERLRSAATIFRRDLASPHFESDGPDPTLREFLRDQRLDQPNWKPPPRGFFRIWQGKEPDLSNPSGQPLTVVDLVDGNNGTDSEGLTFTRSTRHILHFTVKYEGDDPGEYHNGLAPTDHTTQPRSATNPLFSTIDDQELAALRGKRLQTRSALLPGGPRSPFSWSRPTPTPPIPTVPSVPGCTRCTGGCGSSRGLSPTLRPGFVSKTRRGRTTSISTTM